MANFMLQSHVNLDKNVYVYALDQKTNNIVYKKILKKSLEFSTNTFKKNN